MSPKLKYKIVQSLTYDGQTIIDATDSSTCIMHWTGHCQCFTIINFDIFISQICTIFVNLMSKKKLIDFLHTLKYL